MRCFKIDESKKKKRKKKKTKLKMKRKKGIGRIKKDKRNVKNRIHGKIYQKRIAEKESKKTREW